jgi:Na+-driven multidrug efflux pump
VFTNEAGMGTAGIAHGSANVRHPVDQGLMGIMEVFLDTIVICTMTALVILCSGIPVPYGVDAGLSLTADAFSCVLGPWVKIFIAASVCLFAFATILGWGLYGARCAQYLFGQLVWTRFAVLQAVIVVLGAVLNVILDPIFIFLLDMGVRGAALATIISQFVSSLWVLWFLTGKRAILKLKKEYMLPDWKLLREITTLGLPGFIMAGTNCLVQVTCNATLKIYGGDMYIGIMTVINSVREIFGLPVNGLTSGAQPVISFNYGAKEYRRVRSGIVFTSIAGIIFTTVCWILVLVFPKQLLSLFSSDPVLVETGIRSMQIYFFGFFLMSLQFAGQTTFVALGKSKHAIFFSLLRKAVIVFPLTLLLPRLGLGVDGVFLAEPISNLIGGVACFATMMGTIWPMLKREERKLNR